MSTMTKSFRSLDLQTILRNPLERRRNDDGRKCSIYQSSMQVKSMALNKGHCICKPFLLILSTRDSIRVRILHDYSQQKLRDDENEVLNLEEGTRFLPFSSLFLQFFYLVEQGSYSFYFPFFFLIMPEQEWIGQRRDGGMKEEFQRDIAEGSR